MTAPLPAVAEFLLAIDALKLIERRNYISGGEREHVAGMALRHGALIPDLEALWDEQELGQTPEARLFKIADRFLPFLHNITSEGRAWRENGIAKSQVLGAHSFIAGEAPELFAWIEAQVEEAVRGGWLRDG